MWETYAKSNIKFLICPSPHIEVFFRFLDLKSLINKSYFNSRTSYDIHIKLEPHLNLLGEIRVRNKIMMTSCWKIMISLSLFQRQLIWSEPEATFYMHGPEFLFLKKSSTQHLYYRIYLEILTFCKIHWLKGRLLGPRQDDLTIFKCFRVIFFLKKKTIKFPLSFNLYFQQKRAPNLSICHLQRNTLLGFLTPTNRRNGFANFQSCHQVITYLFISLTKSCTLFWKHS